MVETDFSNNVLTAYIKGEIDHDSAARNGDSTRSSNT